MGFTFEALLVAGVALSSLISLPTCGFYLRVTPSFQMEYINLPGVPPGYLIFIEKGKPTDLLQLQLSNGLLKFDTRYTYVSMEWFRNPNEVVNYTMTVLSSNTSIMATPNVTGIPLQGFIDSVKPNYQVFNTSLDCLANGQTILSVIMVYTIDTYSLPPTVPATNETMDNDTMSSNFTSSLLSSENYTAILRVRKECLAPTTPPPPTTAPLAAASLSDGAVAGIVIGSVAFATVIMILVLILIRHKELDKKTRRMTEDLVKMNEIVDSDMRTRTTTGYSGYNGSTAGLPPMGEEELTTLMDRLREEYSNLNDYLVAEEDIVLGKEIGRGAFGRVYDGKAMVMPKAEGLDDVTATTATKVTMQVAIKTVKSAVRPQDIEEFLAEASLMKGFNHPNVVALIGICLEGNVPPKVCLEYMGMGDLRGYLRKSRGIGEGGDIIESEGEKTFSVETPQLLIFCLHIAQGMAYLERKKFVHRDLATRNCMMNDQLIVKIGDFGLARDIHEDNYYRMGTARRLPVKWMSLESLQDQIYTTMSDVWSFGIVMWEVFSLGQSPYPGLANDELPTFLLSGKRLGRPQLCPEDLYAMMATCWSKEPAERPSFQEMTNLLMDYKDSFYANVPLKMGLVQQDYQNINPKAEVGSTMERAMSVSGYSHAGSVATGITYVQDSEGRLYAYNQSGAQYSTQSGHQYSTDVQYTGSSNLQFTGDSSDFVNPGYHLVNTNLIPDGFVCLPPGVSQQMVLMNPASYDQLDPYRNVAVGITPISEQQQPRQEHANPAVLATSVPPPPPTLDSAPPTPRHVGGGDEVFEAHL